jgi:hypothetical protein
VQVYTMSRIEVRPNVLKSPGQQKKGIVFQRSNQSDWVSITKNSIGGSKPVEFTIIGFGLW